jgi:hypothetical protein
MVDISIAHFFSAPDIDSYTWTDNLMGRSYVGSVAMASVAHLPLYSLHLDHVGGEFAV